MMTLNPTRTIPDEVLKSLFRGCEVKTRSDVQSTLLRRFKCDYQNPPLSVTVATYLDILEYLRKVRYPFKSYDDGYIAIGEDILYGYLQGPTGAVNKLAAKMVGPEKSIEIFVKVQSNVRRDMVQEIQEVRKGYLRFRLDEAIAPPGLMGGMLKAALNVAGAKNLTLTWQVPQPAENIYTLTWD